MRILVDGVDIARSAHARKRILLDTMILCYAHDDLSPYHAKSSLIITAAMNGFIEACISCQNLAEFYSVMTGKRVRRPLGSEEAAELCALYIKTTSVGKVFASPSAYGDAFETAGDLSLVGGDVFDSVLAFTARGKADTIWTENVQHFEKYAFLNVENPLDWEWEERRS